MEWIFLAGLFWVLWGLLGWWIAGQKGREPVEGLVLGFVFGPIGAVVELFLPSGSGRPTRRDDFEPVEPDLAALGGAPPERSQEDVLKAIQERQRQGPDPNPFPRPKGPPRLRD